MTPENFISFFANEYKNMQNFYAVLPGGRGHR